MTFRTAARKRVRRTSRTLILFFMAEDSQPGYGFLYDLGKRMPFLPHDWVVNDG